MSAGDGGQLMEHTGALTRTNPLEQLRLRFELWRRNHPGRHRLPQELWSAAANLAQRYGVCRTAKALRLEYYSLKKHMQMGAAGKGELERSPRFVELLPLNSSNIPECSVELENVRGAKIKIQVKGAGIGELSNLTQLLWREL
jgi:hypothetical protein